MCDVRLPWKQDFWINNLPWQRRTAICIVQWWKENTSDPFIPKRNNAQKNFFVVFFPTILAGPQFVETQKFCYHGSVTSPFFYTVGTNSWLGNILDQIITWIEGKWKSMKLACTDWFEKELLENNIIEKRNLCTLSKNILCSIMITTDTRQCR